MKPFSRLTRLAAAGALVVSAVAVWTAAPAGATNTNATENCLSSGVQSFEIANNDTVTITITAGDCTRVTFDPNGTLATATLNSAPLTANSPVFVSTNDSIVFTAPASGQGEVFFRFDDINADVPVIEVAFGYPPLAGSMVDNGNGSMTVTYSGNAQGRYVVVALYAAGHTCVAMDPSTPLYVLDPNLQIAPLAPSPAVVSAGTTALVVGQQGPPAAGQVAAGSYQACMEFIVNNQGTIAQGLAITLGAVTPTTTTTTPSTPVAPTITG